MSYEDARANTDRAKLIRAYVKQKNIDPVYAHPPTDDELLAAAEALDAVGMAGYTAARLEAYIVTGDPTAADLYLEAALNPEATFRDHRAQMGAADADKLIGQIRADLEENQP